MDSGVSPDPKAIQRDLEDQARYSAHLLTQYEGLLAAVRRVDQKYGPFDEFRHWREEAQGGTP